jgi:transposase
MPQGRQIIDGREYVYEYRSIWNKDKQRSEQKREYMGRMIDGQFVPSKRYLLKQELSGEAAGRKRGPVPAEKCTRVFAGATRLFDGIGEKTGVSRDLESCFPELYKEIMSIAYYLALEPSSPLYRFRRWARTHAHPCGKGIPSQRISELLPLITEEGRMEFLRRQSKRRSETEYFFYDSTSVSSYSEQLSTVKYGRNKDGDALPQINLALLLGHSSRLPAYYRRLPGNITDVMTIENLVKGVGYLSLRKIILVMDRGFYSEKNLNCLYRKHYKFIIGARVSLKLIQEQIAPDRADFDRRENYSPETGLFVKTRALEWNYEETKPRSGKVINEKRRMYVHIYYDDHAAADEKLRFNKMLDAMESDILKGRMNPGREKACRKYYDIKKTPKRGVSFAPRQEVIDEARRNFGFFALLSNVEKEPVEALRVYRSKDLIEKSFADIKDRLNMRRISVSSEENLDGKLFIEFVALIYLSYVKASMDDAGLFRNYTMQELFDELDVIEKFQQPGSSPYYGEITLKQRKLYEALGVDTPS